MMAAVLWLTRLIFVSFIVLFGVLLVAMNTDSCASVFETQYGKLTRFHSLFPSSKLINCACTVSIQKLEQTNNKILNVFFSLLFGFHISFEEILKEFVE